MGVRASGPLGSTLDITSGQSRKDVELTDRYRRFMGSIGSALYRRCRSTSIFDVYRSRWITNARYTCMADVNVFESRLHRESRLYVRGTGTRNSYITVDTSTRNYQTIDTPCHAGFVTLLILAVLNSTGFEGYCFRT